VPYVSYKIDSRFARDKNLVTEISLFSLINAVSGTSENSDICIYDIPKAVEKIRLC